MSSYEKILEQVSLIPIIDSHEHLPGRESLRNQDADVLCEYLEHYFSSDLVSAGLAPHCLAKATDPSRPLIERWKLLSPYWDLARNTAYGRALDLAARDLYGISRITGDTIEELNARFRETLRPGANHYQRVLKDLCRIEYSIVDHDLACDREFFRSTCHVTPFVTPKSWDEIEGFERDLGMPISSFDDWLDACRAYVEDGLSRGAAALKCTTAYTRPLFFENTTYHEAEESFNRNIARRGHPSWENGACSFSKAFQDYMMHFILGIADKKGLVVQYHTGLQEGNRNFISNSDPSLMTNLFVQYPRVKFDIFHIGYPFQHVLSALGKAFPNVFIDMCWAHVISPAACVAALSDWLGSVPVNKIIGFGGDYRFVDGVYGHQKIARENVSRALAKKVDEGIFDMETALWIARRLFYDNPKALYE